MVPYVNSYIGIFSVKAKKCGVDVDKLLIISKARNIFKKTNHKTQSKLYVHHFFVVYCYNQSLRIFFFLMKRENERLLD